LTTKTFKFSGKTKWAKVRKPDEKYDNYQVPLYLTDESWNEFKNSGCQLKVHNDEDGKFVTFKRRHAEFNYAKNQQETNGPPRVALLDKQSGEYKDFPDGLVGNGSLVTVWVDVYDTRNGKGHRLIGVGVDDLVEYHKDGEDSTPQIKMPF
jgi:hypothetical protein